MDNIRDLLPGVIQKLQRPELQPGKKISEQWPAIVGPKLKTHTKPYLRPDGELFVWVDQSVLAYELNQKYRLSLLKRAQAVVGEDKVKAVRIRVGQLRAS